ncbi:zf-HC2 domain-containing protein [Marinobacter salinisoli]|uniref:Zf-HC2 domain-containing protein n=1 Tax=Marinobacter salinisoli TaxID=2769486 RepID=A0ABX7MTP9_9GAMM|nr:zf-HC2 domain-containing protein [Marinobacter salinisoli]QSP95683.1 zf-HC2 domain-containing protein [Marinobacter salinisoli]
MLMCRDLAGIASDYIDGELSFGQSVSVKMHLMMCKDCRSFIGNLRMSTRLMQGHSSAQADDEVIDRIRQRVSSALQERQPPSGPGQ